MGNKLISEITNAAGKVVVDAIRSADIKIPKKEEHIWIGNYCVKVKIGDKKKK